MSKHFLIVDNDEGRSETLAQMLEADGHRATTTWSGLEALRLLEGASVDMVLVRPYVADLYIGEFLAAIERLVLSANAMVVEDSEDCPSTFRRIKAILDSSSATTD